MKFVHVVVFITLVLACYTHSYHLPTSCKQIKQKDSGATSRLYIIQPVPYLSPLMVYCEMAIFGRLLHVPPQEPYLQDTCQFNSQCSFYRTEKRPPEAAAVWGAQRVLHIDHAITRLQALRLFGIQVNSYTGYTPPVNRFMYDYILLGIIPKHVAAQRSIQGFTSNGRPVQFKNCDANPNSLFAFLPNHRHQTPSPYHASNLVYERQGVAVDWRKTALPIHHPVRVMPSEFFFLTELHFGGCGTYTSSDRWKDYRATAIGLR